MIFWDSSALVAALDSAAPSFERAVSFLKQKTRHVASRLVLPEAVAAFTRRLRPDSAAIDVACAGVRRTVDRFHLVSVVDDIVEESAGVARRLGLKGADAVHLATALAIAREGGRRGLLFLTLDVEQAAAGRRRGLRVVLPGNR